MSRTTSEGPPAGPAPKPADAELAVARMAEMSADLRGCAVLDGDGTALAVERRLGMGSARARPSWRRPMPRAGRRRRRSTWRPRTARRSRFARAALRWSPSTERFTLASLVLFDMRTVLRDLASGNGVPDRRAPGPGQEDE